MEKRKKKQQLGLFVAVSVILLILLVCSVIFVDYLLYPDVPEAQQDRKTLWVGDVSYFPRKDIRLFLLMGIDREGPVSDSGYHRNAGAADVVLVFVFDETARKYWVLALNRDSMVEMPVLGIGDKPAGSITAQLALSYTYGNGLHQSCVNTKNTVSKLLNNVTIHQYMAMNMDAISILTDAVGGVKVNIQDDFSAVDSSLQRGETVLNGQQAYLFLRSRKDVGDQLNLSRMDRHKEFMSGFLEAFRTKIGKNISSAMEIYNDISPYVVTDCSDQVLSEMFNRFYYYELVDIISPSGTNVTGEEYMEFYIDEDNLFSLVLSLLYTPKVK